MAPGVSVRHVISDVSPGDRRSATGTSPLLWRPLTIPRLGADL